MENWGYYCFYTCLKEMISLNCDQWMYLFFFLHNVLSSVHLGRFKFLIAFLDLILCLFFFINAMSTNFCGSKLIFYSIIILAIINNISFIYSNPHKWRNLKLFTYVMEALIVSIYLPYGDIKCVFFILLGSILCYHLKKHRVIVFPTISETFRETQQVPILMVSYVFYVFIIIIIVYCLSEISIKMILFGYALTPMIDFIMVSFIFLMDTGNRRDTSNHSDQQSKMHLQFLGLYILTKFFISFTETSMPVTFTLIRLLFYFCNSKSDLEEKINLSLNEIDPGTNLPINSRPMISKTTMAKVMIKYKELCVITCMVEYLIMCLIATTTIPPPEIMIKLWNCLGDFCDFVLNQKQQ